MGGVWVGFILSSVLLRFELRTGIGKCCFYGVRRAPPFEKLTDYQSRNMPVASRGLYSGFMQGKCPNDHTRRKTSLCLLYQLDILVRATNKRQPG